MFRAVKSGGKERVLKLFKKNVPAFADFDLYDISQTGINYSIKEGGGNYSFAKIAPRSMYRIFLETSQVDAPGAPYYLHLYSLKYGLKSLAEAELSKIESRELRKKALFFKDMKEAREDLFSGIN